MKTLALKATSLPWSEGKKANYKDLILSCLNFDATGRGFDFEEIASRMRVVEIVKVAKELEEIKLEDADIQKMLACVEQMRWAMPHAEIVQFVEEIRKSAKGS